MIGGKSFWMPRSVSATQDIKGDERGEYSAEYRNYRKFDVASAIVPSPDSSDR
jgi:hypothetical protein